MPSWEEVRVWRKAQREILIERRKAATHDKRKRWSAAIAIQLQRAMPLAGQLRTIGFYWPFKGEYDPRLLMRSLCGKGVRLALPIVVERARPLIFREWWPGIRMAPGIWNIPVPAEGEVVLPDALIAPLVGYDGCGYRLGYGGGYYDRTLAATAKKPLAIGVGFELSRLETIHPQPHDIPMDLIVTERRTNQIGNIMPKGTSGGSLSEPACPAEHPEGASRR